MSRNQYQEDWERRKTYLIRSLFHDIPILSPVPEDQESLAAVSPSNAPPSRPHSPLPPLIIERMPNLHDHPDKFYEDLEKKMKKLYRKLFRNELSSSIESLIEMYSRELEVHSSSEQIEVQSNGHICITLNDNPINQLLDFDQHQICNKSTLTSSQNEYEVLSNGFDKENSTSSKTEQKSSTEKPEYRTSTDTLGTTQETTVVDIHQRTTSEYEQSDSDEEIAATNLSHVNITSCSPVFICKPAVMKALTQNEIQDDNVTRRHKTFQHTDSASEATMSTISEASNKSIEVMRRQRNISLSIGSLAKDRDSSKTTVLSETYTDNDFQNKISFDSLLNESQVQNLKEGLADEVFKEYSNSLNLSTMYDDHSSSSDSNRRRKSTTENDVSRMKTKRQKYGNVGIQVSTPLDCSREITWNQLKNNFFVGAPQIFKLCSCKNHTCKNNR